jgi:hypothetical protein
MLTIEIHVDNLEDKNASPRTTKTKEDANTRRSTRNCRLAKLLARIKSWFLEVI